MVRLQEIGTAFLESNLTEPLGPVIPPIIDSEILALLQEGMYKDVHPDKICGGRSWRQEGVHERQWVRAGRLHEMTSSSEPHALARHGEIFFKKTVLTRQCLLNQMCVQCALHNLWSLYSTCLVQLFPPINHILGSKI